MTTRRRFLLGSAGAAAGARAPVGGDAVALALVELVVGGASQPHLVRAAPGRRDVLLLTVPGLGQPIVPRARVRGAARGTLLLQRL